MNSWVKFYQSIIRRDILTKFNIATREQILKVSLVKVMYKIDRHNLEKANGLNAVKLLLETLTGQAALVHNSGLGIVLPSGRKKSNVFVSTTLRRDRVGFFLNYLALLSSGASSFSLLSSEILNDRIRLKEIGLDTYVRNGCTVIEARLTASKIHVIKMVCGRIGKLVKLSPLRFYFVINCRLGNAKFICSTLKIN